MAVATAEWTELRDRGRHRQDTKYYAALTKSPETPAPLAPDTVQKPFSHSSPSQGMASGGRGLCPGLPGIFKFGAKRVPGKPCLLMSATKESSPQGSEPETAQAVGEMPFIQS